jgi:hypothetical protein
MSEPKPIACSLGASDLRRRLDEIAALGSESLIASEDRDGTRVLRFRPDEETRQRLKAIVAAEAECCPFLDLRLGAGDGELILTVGAAQDGQTLAGEFAAAFAGRLGPPAGERR